MELRGHYETQQCHLCPATFAPPHGRKTLFRHMRNIHGIIPETKRSHLIGRSLKKTEEPKAPEDILEEVLALGLEPEEPKEPEEPSALAVQGCEYLSHIFDGIIFDQVIQSKGRFYEDYVADLEDEVEELKELNKDIKKEVSALEEVRDIQENKIMELTETIIDKDRIIEELRKELEEAKKIKEPEPVPEEPKEPIVIKKKIDKSTIKVKISK